MKVIFPKLKPYFKLEESQDNQGKYLIKLNFDLLDKNLFDGSKNINYTLLQARLLDLSYIDYLRMCRDEFDGQLFGRDTFPICYFNNDKKVKNLIIILNEAMTIALEVRKTKEMKDKIQELENELISLT